MKRTILIFALFCAVPLQVLLAQDASVAAEGVDWVTFEEAVVQAQEENKKIVVDVYAPWCPWCSRLQQEVYADPDVQAFLAEHFVATRLDGDDNETDYHFRDYDLTSAQLAQGLGATGFPTTVFLDSESDYVTRLPGFIDAVEFLQVLRFVGTDAFLEESYEDFVARTR